MPKPHPVDVRMRLENVSRHLKSYLSSETTKNDSRSVKRVHFLFFTEPSQILFYEISTNAKDAWTGRALFHFGKFALQSFILRMQLRRKRLLLWQLRTVQRLTKTRCEKRGATCFDLLTDRLLAASGSCPHQWVVLYKMPPQAVRSERSIALARLENFPLCHFDRQGSYCISSRKATAVA